MKTLIAGALMLCLGTAAGAANLSINLTGATPTYTTDANWITPPAETQTEASFTGTYGANATSTGSNTVFVVGPTGDELYTLAISYSGPGGPGTETFSVTATKDPGNVVAPGSSIKADATGSSVDFTAEIPGLPSNITIQETANVPIPEPASFTLIGLGLVALGAARRHFGSKAS
jgi:hypothetical protein